MRQSKRLFLLPALTALAVLAGCRDEPEAVEDDTGRSASGEVLDGSISDAMLPLGELRSQPPRARIDAGDSDDAAAPADPPEAAEDGIAAAGQLPAEPAAAPAPVLDLPPETAAE